MLNYLGYSWVDQGLEPGSGQGHAAPGGRAAPEDGFIVDSLGWAYYRLGEYDKAVTYLERAVELEPGDPVINDHLGDAYWRVGRMREARFQWQRALTFKPEPDVAARSRPSSTDGLPADARQARLSRCTVERHRPSSISTSWSGPPPGRLPRARQPGRVRGARRTA